MPARPDWDAEPAEAAWLPLGGRWLGQCLAEAETAWNPDERLLGICNLGYARGRCLRFPQSKRPDAVRFAVRGDDGGALRISYVVESGHLPFDLGDLRIERAGEPGNPTNTSPLLGRQAACYADSYRRRKGAGIR